MIEHQKLLGFAGKKRSGKGTSANFVHSLALVYFGLTPMARIDELGQLIVEVQGGEERHLNLDSQDPDFLKYMEENVWPFIRKFSLASHIKVFAYKCLGLTFEQVYGADKDTETDVLWENLPVPRGNKAFASKRGKLTAREVLQFYGSEIGRAFDEDIWVKTLLREVERSSTGFAVVDDVRFSNEARLIREAGGKVIYLTRNVSQDSHASENGMSPEDADAVIDNQTLSIEETNGKIIELFMEWGWMAKAPEDSPAKSVNTRKGFTSAK